ncbi:tail fiber assembly protein [Citrobacter sp. Cpo142]|uniref:tail fiber assembly protein n=1 Tax=Citrobacter sp. Cpo142 TaxID=2985151 RepID=UPI00257674EB|nr:tail fiber assembly protein [Citrobacter sp. Cpo142]MDM2775694.1 tail fiber assembly protein [Citrobacter sp. Cpo142]
MRKYNYDAVTNSFYPYSLKSEYEAVGMWPETGVDVDESIFKEFTSSSPGKKRVAGDDGLPAWVDIPAPTHDELVEQAEAKRQSLLDEANKITADWRTELTLGIISDDDKAKLTEWMKYIKAVKAVDTSTAPDVIWPEKPAA